MSSNTLSVSEIINALEQVAPASYQESYDNAGLIVGSKKDRISKAIVALDATEAVIDEAIEHGAQLVIAHHPIVFKGLKRFNGGNYVERTIIKAIKNNIAIYAIHTNLDNVHVGVNAKIAEILALQNTSILKPMPNDLRKLVTFIPMEYSEQVQSAIFEAGGGHIGNYSNCGFTTNGTGSFKALNGTEPFVGKTNELHHEREQRFETIFPAHKQFQVLNALQSSHPYEEVAYDIYTLQNLNPKIGAGMVGYLKAPVPTKDFLQLLKQKFDVPCIKHTNILSETIQKVAFCGGSGSFLLRNAIGTKADIYISGDFKYHEYFDAEDKILIADIGHYESEQFTKDLILELLKEKFPTFAAYNSEVRTNPVNYL